MDRDHKLRVALARFNNDPEERERKKLELLLDPDQLDRDFQRSMRRHNRRQKLMRSFR